MEGVKENVKNSPLWHARAYIICPHYYPYIEVHEEETNDGSRRRQSNAGLSLSRDLSNQNPNQAGFTKSSLLL